MPRRFRPEGQVLHPDLQILGLPWAKAVVVTYDFLVAQNRYPRQDDLWDSRPDEVKVAIMNSYNQDNPIVGVFPFSDRQLEAAFRAFGKSGKKPQSRGRKSRRNEQRAYLGVPEILDEAGVVHPAG